MDTTGCRKSLSLRPLEHQGETSTPRCGPRARDDNSAPNTYFKRVFEAIQTSRRDAHAKMRAKKRKLKSPSLRPLEHQGETGTPRRGPRVKQNKSPEVTHTSERDKHA
eukprot:3995618-Pleurochrysis_carterae.AAC.1